MTERIIHKTLLEELSKGKQAGEKNLTIRRKKIVRLDHKWIWASPIEIAGKKKGYVKSKEDASLTILLLNACSLLNKFDEALTPFLYSISHI